MPKVIFQPDHQQTEIPDGKTLMHAGQLLSQEGAALFEVPCGGKGKCGQCRVQVTQGKAAPCTDAEKQLLSSEELARGFRLACQCVPLETVEVAIPPDNQGVSAILQVTGPAITTIVDPPVVRHRVTLHKPSLENPYSLWQQIEKALAAKSNIQGFQVDTGLIRQNNAVCSNETIVVNVTGSKITNIYKGDNVPRPLGLAVDLGTTTVAGYLVDLKTGKELEAGGLMNPQAAYGADVVSRLAHAVESPKNSRQLCRIIRDCIGQLARMLTESRGLMCEHIEYAVIAGNTAMHHLFLEWPVSQLCRSPFVPAHSAPVEEKACELGFKFSPGGLVYLVPPVAGYVGGDHTAMVLAGQIDDDQSIVLGMDIGTNTELVLCRRGKLFACSCASGPTFEGAQIRQGVKSIDGAVYNVRIDESGKVNYSTIGDTPPIGFCGSGVVDAVAELVRNNIVDSLGLMDRSHCRVRINEQTGEPEFLLAEARKSNAWRDLVLGQADISAIQLGKAAIAAGLDILLATAGVKLDEVEKVVVAGGFGSHLEISSAITLGMFPDLPLERFVQVGNAAGIGARMILISKREKQKAESLANKINYLELGAHPDFGDFFFRAMKFSSQKSQSLSQP